MTELLIWSDPSEGREGVSRAWRGAAVMERKEEQKLLMLIKIDLLAIYYLSPNYLSLVCHPNSPQPLKQHYFN